MRLVLLNAARPVVWSHDPAIAPHLPARTAFLDGEEGDKEHALAERDAVDAWIAKFRRYSETYDMAHLPVRDGETPAVFMIGQLTRDQIAAVASEKTLGERVLLEMAYAIHEIRGVTFVDGDGKPVKPEREKTPAGLKQPDQVMQIFADPKLREEIYGHVMRANRLTLEVQKSDPA